MDGISAMVLEEFTLRMRRGGEDAPKTEVSTLLHLKVWKEEKELSTGHTQFKMLFTLRKSPLGEVAFWV